MRQPPSDPLPPLHPPTPEPPDASPRPNTRPVPSVAFPQTELPAAERRGHTAIVGVTGDGKTFTMYSLLVRDLEATCACIVLNTHFSPYNAQDQPIDLRPLLASIFVYRTPDAIHQAATAIEHIIDRRLDRYHDNLPITTPITVFLGEWRSIQRVLGKKRAIAFIQRLLDEGRKARVWAVIEMHSALIAYFGGDSGLREAFHTRLAGNVDPVSWRVLVGPNIPQYEVPRGQWATANGPIIVRAPSIERIRTIAALRRTVQQDADILLLPDPATFPQRRHASETPTSPGDAPERASSPPRTVIPATAPPPSTTPPDTRAVCRYLIEQYGPDRPGLVSYIRKMLRGSNEELGILVRDILRDMRDERSSHEPDRPSDHP